MKKTKGKLSVKKVISPTKAVVTLNPVLTKESLEAARKNMATSKNAKGEIMQTSYAGVEEDKKKSDLNPEQEFFCQLYSTDREFFGNGVQSYIEAYNPDTTKPNWYKTTCAAASRLLTNVKVLARINEIMEETGFNDVNVDKQLGFLVTQHADFGTKLGAIREYNKLKKRVDEAAKVTVSFSLSELLEQTKK